MFTQTFFRNFKAVLPSENRIDIAHPASKRPLGSLRARLDAEALGVAWQRSKRSGPWARGSTMLGSLDARLDAEAS